METPTDKIKWPPNIHHSSAYWSMAFREWLAEEITHGLKLPVDQIAGNVICNYEFTVKMKRPEAPAGSTPPPQGTQLPQGKCTSLGVFDIVEAWCEAVRPPQEQLMGYLSDFQYKEPGSIEWVRGLFASKRIDGTIPEVT
jgi:hypothetical protein